MTPERRRRSTRSGRRSSSPAAGSAPRGPRSTAARASHHAGTWCWPRSSPGPRPRCAPTSSATRSSARPSSSTAPRSRRSSSCPRSSTADALVPGLLRAELRLRPGLAQDHRRARRRRVGHQRPEGVDHPGPVRRLLLPAGPHRPGREAQAGISYLLVPMQQPGIEVRGITQPDGTAEFNEVFFTDARCPKDNVVGGVNNGWKVANSTLGVRARHVGHHRLPPLRGGVQAHGRAAQANGSIDDPLIRQGLARVLHEDPDPAHQRPALAHRRRSPARPRTWA
jgi:hypothetical protein